MDHNSRKKTKLILIISILLGLIIGIFYVLILNTIQPQTSSKKWIKNLNKKQIILIFMRYINLYISNIFSISFLPGDYCESVIPDPIPNSAVKPFCANGTLS